MLPSSKTVTCFYTTTATAHVHTDSSIPLTHVRTTYTGSSSSEDKGVGSGKTCTRIRPSLITHPGSGFSSPISGQPRGCQLAIPNDTSSESSRRDVSSADLLGTNTIPFQLLQWRYRAWQLGLGLCHKYTVVTRYSFCRLGCIRSIPTVHHLDLSGQIDSDLVYMTYR